MLSTEEFLAEIADLDYRLDTMFVQYQRSEENYPLHQHQKAQLAYVEEGLAYLVTLDKTYFLPARHYVWIPPGLWHRLVSHSPHYLVHSVYFAAAAAVDATTFYEQLGIYPVNTLLYELLRYTKRWHGHLAPAPEAPYLFLKSLKLTLPSISGHALPIALPTTDDARLLPVLAHIYHHVGDLLELSALARQFGFSTRTLSRLFQQVLHLSFSQYLKLRRVTAAMELLLQTPPASISEVAYAVGYTSLSAFSNVFYQVVHRRPSEFLPREATPHRE